MVEPRPASERRRHPRVAASWPVSLQLPDGTHVAELRDISVSGICFFLDRKIPEMTVLDLRLELPAHEGVAGPTEVAGRGAVVRCEPVSPHLDHYEIAVFFNEIGDDERQRLQRFVETRLSATL